MEELSYIMRNRSDEERSAFIMPFQNALKPGEGKKPIEEDEQRRKLILSKLMQEVKGLGDGSDKGNVNEHTDSRSVLIRR
jgi:translation initiation factor 3 subunit M